METPRPIDIGLRLGAIGGMIAGCGPALTPHAAARGENWTGSPATVETSCTDMRGFAIPRPTPPMPEGVVCINAFEVPGSGSRIVVLETHTRVTFNEIGPNARILRVSRQPVRAAAQARLPLFQKLNNLLLINFIMRADGDKNNSFEGINKSNAQIFFDGNAPTFLNFTL